MKIAISQPTYLPWLGYFDLIDQVDMFVFLDNVQFEKQSWQQRNRIKTPMGLQWLTVPVIFRGRFGQLIQDVEIRDTEFCKNHLRAIELNYRRAPFFDLYFPELKEHFNSVQSGSLLGDFTIRLIQWIVNTLNIQTQFMRSSTIKSEGSRSARLVNLCRSLGANSYLSPLGSMTYLMNDVALFEEASIEVKFQNYEHPVYKQLFQPFSAYATALDVLFNEGSRSLEIIRSGRRTSWMPSEIVQAITA